VGNAQATGEQLNATKADAQAGANHKAISPLPVANESSMLGVMHQESSTNAEVRANGSEESGLVAPTWALVIATVALAVYTARLFRATVKLGDEAKRTSEQQRADTKESLEVSEAAAAAATKSADVAEKTLKVTQRGYLTLSRVKFEGLSAGQQPQRFMCATANKGNTPIRIVAKYLMRGVVDSLPDTPVLGAQADAVATPLAPGDDVGHNFTLDPLPESKLAEVLAGTKNFFIYGFFDYVDVFSEQHRMGFCFRYSLTAKELRQFGNEAYNYAT
jgi:hypothetical protein